MFKLICDRCGKTYATFQNAYDCPNGTYNIVRRNSDSADDPFGDNPDREAIHLCPACEKDLSEFLTRMKGE